MLNSFFSWQEVVKLNDTRKMHKRDVSDQNLEQIRGSKQTPYCVGSMQNRYLSCVYPSTIVKSRMALFRNHRVDLCINIPPP